MALPPTLGEAELRALLKVRLLEESSPAAAPPPDPTTHAPADWKTFAGVESFIGANLWIADRKKRLVPFVPNLTQRRVIAAEREARERGILPWFIILKFRKPGVSAIQQAISYWTCWHAPLQECLTLSHRDRDTQTLFRMVSLFYEHQPKRYRHEKTAAARMEIAYPGWRSLYMAQTAGALEIARGATLSRVHGSEAAFYPDLGTTHTSLNESMADDAAYVLESTANGQEGRGQMFYEFWQTAEAGQSEFIPLFFPWQGDPGNVRALTTDQDKDLFREWYKADAEAAEMRKRFSLSDEQLYWWLTRKRRLIAKGERAKVIHQEHPADSVTAFLVSGGGYYDDALLDIAQSKCVEPLATEEFMGGVLRIFELPDEEDPAGYIGGCDPAEGSGGDLSAAVGFNARTGRQAFSWESNRVDSDHVGSDVLPALGRRWAHPRSGAPIYWIVERINHGHNVLTGLIRIAHYPIDRIYHHAEPTVPNAQPQLKPGWPHGTIGHVELETAVRSIVRDHQPLVLDAHVIASIRKVTKAANGNAEFTGRDHAVASGLAAIGWSAGRDPVGAVSVGGRVVEFGVPEGGD